MWNVIILIDLQLFYLLFCLSCLPTFYHFIFDFSDFPLFPFNTPPHMSERPHCSTTHIVPVVGLVLVALEMWIHLPDKLSLLLLVHEACVQAETGQETLAPIRWKLAAKIEVVIFCCRSGGGGGVTRHCAAAVPAA